MANDFLVSKWKIWYESLDVNHDGKISFEDVEESRQKFSGLHHLDAAKTKMVSENFEQWWTDYIFCGRSGEISEDQFVESLQADYNKDPAAFKSKMDKCFDKFFDVIDTNKDRSIDESEFLIAFQAYGHENVAKDSEFFNSYPRDKDGAVPLRTVVESWVDFACNNDASKPGIVKTAFEKASAKK